MSSAMRERGDGEVVVRVVALERAAAEVLYALELQHLLVGRSHECTYPPHIQSLPSLSFLSVEYNSPSVSDSKEETFIQKALAPIQINLRLLKELKPDIIITQDRCEACVRWLDELQRACGRFIFGDDERCRILSLNPLTIQDIFHNIQSIANICHSSGKGKALVSKLKTRWNDTMKKTPQWADGVPFVNVACLTWLEPLIGAGHWIPEIVGCSGGFNMFGNAGHLSPLISWPEFVHSNPDVILIFCLGLNIERTSSMLASLPNASQWRQLRAVISKRVYIVNGERYFNVPGPTVVNSAELLGEILHGVHPEQVFMYEGTGYIRWEAESPVNPAVLLNGSQLSLPGASEDYIVQKEVQNQRGNSMSPGNLDSDSTVSSGNRGRVFVLNKDNELDCLSMETNISDKKSTSIFSTSPSNHSSYLADNPSKTRRLLDFGTSCITDAVAHASLQDSIPKALTHKIVRQENYMQVLHNTWIDSRRASKLEAELKNDAAPLKSKMELYPSCAEAASMDTSNEVAKHSLEISIRGSPLSAGRSTHDRSSSPSPSSSRDHTDMEVLSRMWASTEAAARFQSQGALRKAINHGKSRHNSAKDVQECGNIVAVTPVSKQTTGIDIQSDQRLEKIKKSNTGFGPNYGSINDSWVSLSMNTKPIGAVRKGENEIPRSVNCTLNLRNLKLTMFSQKALALRNHIFKAVKELTLADCLLLSGGLGSTILAEAAKVAFPESLKVGVTVLAGPHAKDNQFSRRVSKEYDMTHIIVGGGDEGNVVELMKAQLDFVIETLRTFNPSEIQKALALAAALMEAKSLGFSSVVIGDGVDELFAGPHSFQSMSEDEFNCYRYQQLSSMTYSSVSLGTSLGVKVLQPYLNEKVVEFAAGLSKIDLVGPMDGKVHDRFFLRHAFSEVLSARRSKVPIEVGSGTAILSEYFSRRVSRAQFKTEASHIYWQDNVQIRDPEHLAYYLAFKRIFNDRPPPGMDRWGSNPCLSCGYQLTTMKQMHCMVCGHHPARHKLLGTKLDYTDSPNSPQNSINRGMPGMVDQSLRQNISLKQWSVTPSVRKPSYDLREMNPTNIKSLHTSACQPDDTERNVEALNDAYEGFVASSDPSTPIKPPQGFDNFRHPETECQIQRKQSWFWKLAASITTLVFVLQFQKRKSG